MAHDILDVTRRKCSACRADKLSPHNARADCKQTSNSIMLKPRQPRLFLKDHHDSSTTGTIHLPSTFHDHHGLAVSTPHESQFSLR